MTTEDKSTPSSLSAQNQGGTDRPQNKQVEDTMRHLGDHGYNVTEGYSNSEQFSKVSAEQPPGKNWWSWRWLHLLIVIALLGIGFTWVQTQTTLQIARDNRSQELHIVQNAQEEATLKAYLDDMTTLLLNDKLGSNAVADKAASAEAAVIARAKTLTVLRRLTDPEQKAIVVLFLYDAHLIGYFPCNTCPIVAPVIDLTVADLDSAQLGGAHLSGANLSGANLSGAHLFNADLRGANLTNADLSYTSLSSAHLGGANLGGANLINADLSFANLNGAQVTTEQLALAKSLQGATMPDGSKHP